MYQWLEKQRERGRLLYAFKSGGFSIKHGDRQVYPLIHSVRFFEGRREFVFTLPNGLDPKLLLKNEYVFKQVFGRNLELSGDLKRFVLNVYQKAIPKEFPYHYESMDFKGLAIPIIAGKDIRGEIASYDMEKFPHLLIAGETGSGKSTQLRSILTTLIHSQSPEELRFVMGDLKRSEFHIFRNIAHVDSVSMNKADLSASLAQINEEMEEREELLDRHEKTHMNQIQGADRRPNIIVCIDEVAQLKKEKAIMNIVEDVSAIGRALGIYLILSMQRPDREVLDGKLKNNLTIRMAFKHADGINSRITLGHMGAEELPSEPGGRFLMKKDGIMELQAPYLSDDKARKMLNPYRVKKKVESKKSKPQILNRLEG